MFKLVMKFHNLIDFDYILFLIFILKKKSSMFNRSHAFISHIWEEKCRKKKTGYLID